MSEHEPSVTFIADGLIKESMKAFQSRQALATRMDYIELGGMTTRCHTMPINHPQSVAAHSFGVAWWCWLLTDRKPSTALLMCALAHDLAEHITGDIPSPAKTLLGIGAVAEAAELNSMRLAGIDVGPISSHETIILKLSDSLELAQYCYREKSMGNHHSRVSAMFANISAYINELADGPLDYHVTAREAMALIDQAWRATP